MSSSGKLMTGASIVDGSVAPVDLTNGTPGYVLQSGLAVPSWVPISRKNYLLNGGMQVHQRIALDVASAAVDWTYHTADRWKTLSDGVSIWNMYVFSNGPRVSVPFGMPRSLLFQSPAGTSTKGGAIQILEARDTNQLSGRVVSLQAQVLQAATSDIRMAILAWSGAVDAVVDPVSTWNAAGTNPTLNTGAGWVYCGPAPVNANPTAGVWTRVKLENVTIPTNANNVAVMIWNEDVTQAAGNGWYISDVQLEAGPVCTEFEYRPFGLEVAACQRYYEKSYALETPTGAVGAADPETFKHYDGIAASTAGTTFLITSPSFVVQKRAVPTTLIYHTNGTLGSINYGGVATRSGCTAGSPSTRRPFMFLSFDNTSAQVITAGVQSFLHWASAAEL